MKQMYEQENNEIEINLQELFFTLKRNLLKIVLVTILFASVTAGYSKFFITPIYSSTAQLYILASKDGQQIYNLTAGDQLAQDYIRIVTTKTVLQKAIDDLKLDMDYHDLQGQITVENPEETRFMTITVRDTNSKRAQKLAQRIAVVTSKTVSKAMDVPAPTIVAAAERATIPDSPNVKMNTVLGGFIGFIFAILVVFIRVVMNDTINNEDDIERYLGIIMLAQLPSEYQVRYKRKSGGKRKEKDLYKNLSVDRKKNSTITTRLKRKVGR